MFQHIAAQALLASTAVIGFLDNAVTVTVHYTAAPVLAAEQPQETLHDLAARIADEYGVPQQTLFNLIESESSWNPEADNGEDRGIVQISRTYHGEVPDECAFSPECAMRWAAQRIADGYLHEWVAANCYLLVKTQIPDLPHSSQLLPVPGLERGGVGSVALFDYDGVPHYAYIEHVSAEGFTVLESNYEPAKIGRRHVNWDDPRLVGFWRPPQNTPHNE